MNIKKWGALVAAGALAASLALFGCSSGDQGTTTSSTSGNDAGYTLVNDGKLTVAASLDFPPFENLNGDKPEGFAVDLMTLLAEEMGLECEYLPSTKFDTIVPLIQTGGKADVGVSSFTITDKRLQQVDFTDPYCNVNQSITVRSDSGITDVAQLEGKKIGAQSGTTGYEWAAENIKDAEVTGYDGCVRRARLRPDRCRVRGLAGGELLREVVLGLPGDQGDSHGRAVCRRSEQGEPRAHEGAEQSAAGRA